MERIDFIDLFYQILAQSQKDPGVMRVLQSEESHFLNFVMLHIGLTRAQIFQDLWVLYELHKKHDGYFVEFGSTNGLDISNTWLLEKKFGWKGALAEPAPIWKQDLLKNRSCFISTECIAGETGHIVEFNQTSIPEYSTLNNYSNSDTNGDIRAQGEIIPVRTISLMDFLRQADAPAIIDYMSVDTEGSEYEILSAFDFSRYNVRLLSVEHNNTPQRDSLHKLLTAHGYRRKFTRFSFWDDWYIRDAS